MSEPDDALDLSSQPEQLLLPGEQLLPRITLDGIALATRNPIDLS